MLDVKLDKCDPLPFYDLCAELIRITKSIAD